MFARFITPGVSEHADHKMWRKLVRQCFLAEPKLYECAMNAEGLLQRQALTIQTRTREEERSSDPAVSHR